MLGSVTHDKLAADVQLAQARQQMQAMGKQMRAMQAELTQAQAAAKAIAPPPTVPAAE